MYFTSVFSYPGHHQGLLPLHIQHWYSSQVLLRFDIKHYAWKIFHLPAKSKHSDSVTVIRDQKR